MAACSAGRSMYWDWFQFAWGEWVINYDFSHQMTLGQDVQQSSRELERSRARVLPPERNALHARAARARSQDRSLAVVSCRACSSLLVALLFALRGRSMIRYAVARWSLRARRGGNLTASLAALEYTEMLRLLERSGWKKSPSQTPLEFAAAIPAADRLRSDRPLHRAVSVRALRQSSRADRADVLAPPLHPRLASLAQARDAMNRRLWILLGAICVAVVRRVSFPCNSAE